MKHPIKLRFKSRGGRKEKKMIRVNHLFKKLIEGLTLSVLSPLFSIVILPILISNQLALAVPNGGYARPELLIQPEELKSLIDQKDPEIRIIDVREKIKYLAGHIPGAVNIWRPDIVDKDHPLPGMIAPPAQVEELMGRLGISHRPTLVIYSDGADGARLWWVLAYYGFPIQQMKLLDGSLEGWKARGYPTEMLSPQISQAQFKLPGKTKSMEPLLCGLPEVRGALKDPKKVVLDVRAKEEYLGEKTLTGAVKPGRIPGVAFIEWREVLIKDGPYKGYWKPADEIKRLFADIGVTPDKEVFIY